MLRLDFGCGRTKPPGFIGVDAYQHVAVDIVHDLNVMPWPWADNSVDCVRFSRSIIHVKYLPTALEEVVRILKPGGEFWIISVHPSHPETYQPEHVLPGLTLAGLMSLTKSGPGSLPYSWHGGFELISVKLTVDSTWKYPWTKVAAYLARTKPYGYEQWFAWLAPIRELEWKARKRSTG